MMKENEMIKSYSKHFGLDTKGVKQAVKIAKAISKEWNKRFEFGLSDEEYDIIEGIIIKHIAKKK